MTRQSDAFPHRTIDGLAIAAGYPGMPSEDRFARMEAAVSAVSHAFDVDGISISHSPLGPAWSSDIDVYAAGAVEELNTRAQRAGWVSLDGLLAHLGHATDGHWAVVEEGRVLAPVDIQPGTARPVERSVLGRIGERGHDGLREVLELRHIVARDLYTPDADEAAAIDRIERSIAAWTGSPPEADPPPSSTKPTIRSRIRPQVRVGFSGIDGSGKSSSIAAFQDALAVSGIDSEIVWTRPGMRLRLLDRLAHVAKRLLGRTSGGLNDLAAGTKPSDVPSRRGVVGWCWNTLVTVAFLWDVHKRLAATRSSVVIFDRHLLDAIGTVEALYEGADTRFSVWLIRRLHPHADATVWLDIPAHVSVERKPDEVFNEILVTRMVDRYQANRASIPRLDRIDGRAPQDEVAFAAFRTICARLAAEPAGRYARAVARFRARTSG